MSRCGTGKLNHLNCELQGKGKTAADMINAFKATMRKKPCTFPPNSHFVLTVSMISHVLTTVQPYYKCDDCKVGCTNTAAL